MGPYLQVCKALCTAMGRRYWSVEGNGSSIGLMAMGGFWESSLPMEQQPAFTAMSRRLVIKPKRKRDGSCTVAMVCYPLARGGSDSSMDPKMPPTHPYWLCQTNCWRSGKVLFPTP